MSKPTRKHAVVLCNIHGKQSELWEGQMVKVNQIPNTKKEKRAGCPLCKKDRKY